MMSGVEYQAALVRRACGTARTEELIAAVREECAAAVERSGSPAVTGPLAARIRSWGGRTNDDDALRGT